MEYWEAFQEFEFSNETLMVVGALLVLIAVMQIIKSSVKLIFWVLLAGVGALGALYGHDRSAVRLPDDLIEEARNLAGPGGLTENMMQALCLKVLNEQSSSSAWMDLNDHWYGQQGASVTPVRYSLLGGQSQFQVVDFDINRDVNHEVEHLNHTFRR